MGGFGGLVELAGRRRALWPAPDAGLRRRLDDVLGMPPLGEHPTDVRRERSWTADGLAGEELSWSVGFGPRTHAWIIKPEESAGPMPGVLALHCHAGMKRWGKEKIADGPDEVPAEIRALRSDIYGGRAFANDLARRGFVVLCHDALLWGARRFPLSAMPDRVRRLSDDLRELAERRGEPIGDERHYDMAAHHHEPVIAKYCNLLGTSILGLVAREDLIALRLLGARPDVLPGAIGCAGLSGGGLRAGLLHALSDDVRAAVVVAMLSSFPDMLDDHVDRHSWLSWPPGIGTVADWPDVLGLRAPSPLLAMFCAADRLFPLTGMRRADARLRERYAAAGRPEAYTGRFHSGGHAFDRPMQDEAFTWLARTLFTPRSFGAPPSS
ncbi:acetylesterase [Actinomadura sp. HBU206391]|uniref:acetylesterase n=1 Tax=Actinomadura sp. HBU206391 TaxID=2731692 RepID=UPI00164FF0B1|nr:acetylesterase [Actinomadura sp. HBU206391]MBC6458214.1 acetylesterase [Actinomadura sp. HBU206391]